MMPRFRVPLACGLTVAATIGLFASVPTAAGAAPQGRPAEVLGASASSPAEAVTLINGDRILVSRTEDGSPTAITPGGRDYYSRLVDGALYMIPVDAQDALAGGRLDMELFNVTGLLESGFGDADRETLPLIMEAPSARARQTTGLTVQAELESIGAAAVSVDKESAAAAYDELLGDKARAANTVKKIWLDAKVKPAASQLDPATGVAQTGAPEVWDSGVDGGGTTVAILDTGYDPTHPDLADRVSAAQDFTGEGVEDRNGHGTHVASTVGGSGSADSSKVGMAPGADLIVGKVLGQDGGLASWVIDGMEWAVEQQADVVNMSLGSAEPTDCTDPMALAAEALSQQATTLFVIAAGNSGARETIGSPGCAEGALTVGAVDSDGDTADFSSRGATLDAHTLKPDIVAPGVNIVGAQAGTGEYVAMSGTSMAAPHVAGAAALVRQAHPDWSAQQIKASLAASAKKDADGTVYEQGAGELWVPGAVTTPITSDVSVELAAFDWPHGPDEVATKQVTYTNTSDRDITLKLKIEDLTGADGESVPAKLIKLGARTVTVPARGSASVDVTATGRIGELRESAYGEIGARISASPTRGDKDVHVTTSVGFWLEPKTVTVTVKGIDRTGSAATSGYLDITDMHQPSRFVHDFTGEEMTLRLRAGSYFLTSFISNPNEDGTLSYSYLGDPDVTFTEDTTLVLDARTAAPVEVTADRPAEIRSGSIGVHRAWGDRWQVGASVFADRDPQFFVAGTDKVRDGTFRFGTYVRAYDPAVTEAQGDYVYNLAFTDDGRVPADHSHRVRDATLANVSETWFGQGEGWEATEWTRLVPADGTGPFFTSSGTSLAAPGTRTSYYTPGLPWQQLAQSGNVRPTPDVWFDPVRTYRKGESTQTEWFKLPTNTGMAANADGSAARVAERQGTTVGFVFPHWKDSVEGRVGTAGFMDLGRMELFKDGVSLGQSPFASGQWDVGTDDAELRAVVTHERVRRGEFWAYGLGTKTIFTFASSAPEGDAVESLPIAMPRFDAAVDELNRAPGTTDFPVAVSLQGQDGYDPGEIVSMTAQVSYDTMNVDDGEGPEGYTWTDVPVEKNDGTWRALIDNSRATGDVVSLHIVLEDSHGTITEQYVQHLYGVK